MHISRKQLIKFLGTAVFMSAMLTANFYAVRKMNHYGMELYFYDKLLVAYNIGSGAGLKEEVDKILADERYPRELAMARDFMVKLKDLKDPGVFLNDKVNQDKEKVIFFKRLRNAAIILMFVILAWRLFMNMGARFKFKSN